MVDPSTGPVTPENTEPPAPRLSARDLVAPVAFFLGALLIAAAIAVGPVVGGRMEAVPLDIDSSWVADGASGSRVLNPCSLDSRQAQVLEASVQQRRRVVVVQPSDADRVTLQAGTSLGVDSYLIDGGRKNAEDVCKQTTLAATIDRVTVDRETALVSGTSSEIQFDEKKAAVPVPDRIGITYLLPYGVGDARSFFDPASRQSVPLERVGTETIDGRETIEFRAMSTETNLSAFDTRGAITRPASWFGSFRGVRPTEELTAHLYRAAEHRIFVDAATGVFVDQRVRLIEDYRFVPIVAERSAELADFRLTNVDADLIGDRQSIQEAAQTAADRQWPVTLTRVILPIVFGVLGLIAFAVGIVVTVRERRTPAN